MSYPEFVITLTLLHPVQGTAVQSWSFHHDQTVRIGRAVDNEVVLYSAVVSRYHVELRHESKGWFVHNIGVNGTFLEGRKIESELLETGQIIRLARSGPNIQVEIKSATASSSSDESQKVNAGLSDAPVVSSLDRTSADLGLALDRAEPDDDLTQANTKPEPEVLQEPEVSHEPEATICKHERTPKSSLICIECGEPVHVLQEVGPYKVLKHLEESDSTFQAWKNQKTYILRTAPAQIFADDALTEAFCLGLQRAEMLNHGGIPRMIEVLESEGRHYLVYEMVYGLSVHDWVRDRGALSLGSAIAWITDVARIVDYLHQMEPPFIHQGINPKTIIRPTIPQGSHSVMLVNFGQYKHLIPRESQSASDLAYISPFKAPGELSESSDLYALGSTFLFMLTGEDPYKFMQLGDRAYILEVDSMYDIPQNALELIGRLLQTQDAQPITTVAEAIDHFLHLV